MNFELRHPVLQSWLICPDQIKIQKDKLQIFLWITFKEKLEFSSTFYKTSDQAISYKLSVFLKLEIFNVLMFQLCFRFIFWVIVLRVFYMFLC